MATAKKAPTTKAAPETKVAPAAKAAPAKKAASASAKEVAAPAKAAAPAKKTASAKGAAPVAVEAIAANKAFMKELTPSSALAAVVGAAPLPRTQVVKKLWDYIKAHNLQDQTDKRRINADAKLKAVFDKEQVTMFEIAGLIGKHLS